MEDYKEMHQRWLENLIEKKVSFFGEDEYASYFNISINNEVVKIAYDGDMVLSAIYLCRDVQNNDETLIYDDSRKVRTTKVSTKRITRIRDFIAKYLVEYPV